MHKTVRMLVGETMCREGALVQQGSRVIGYSLLEEVGLALQGNHIHEVEWGGCGRNGAGETDVRQGGASSVWCTLTCMEPVPCAKSDIIPE